MGFFTDAFQKMSEEQKESFYKTIFLNDTSAYAAELRNEYYRKVLNKMGENVRIGAGVKIVNPQNVSIGNNVKIEDNVTIIARHDSEIRIGDGSELKERVIWIPN